MSLQMLLFIVAIAEVVALVPAAWNAGKRTGELNATKKYARQLKRKLKETEQKNRKEIKRILENV